MVIHRRFAFLAGLLVASSLVACGGSAVPDGRPGPVDAPVEASAPPSAGDAGVAAPLPDAAVDVDAAGDAATADAGRPQCNALANVAEDVSIVASPTAPPPADGGVIADGVYVVRVATLHTGVGGAAGDTGKTVKMTVKVSGAQVESVFDGVTRSATIVVDGATLRTTSTCPSQGTDDVAFSATPTTLSLYLVDNAGTRVYSLEKL